MERNSTVIVKELLSLCEGCDVQILENGRLDIGHFHTNIDCEITCGHSISIGNNVTAGRHVRIKDFNGHYVSYPGYPIHAAVTICDDVWLCTGSTINPGVKIGKGSVIADNANVIEPVSENSFSQGNPSTEIANNIFFKL